MLKIWSELNTPSDFKNDWYGELTNQEAHTLLGVRLAVLVCIAWAAVFGDLPYKILVLGLIGLGYLAIEIRQGWAPGDSWFDAAMVLAGAVGVLVPITEVAAAEVWYVVKAEINMLWLFGIWIVRDWVLSRRVLKRVST